jgi:hypothetical protein
MGTHAETTDDEGKVSQRCHEKHLKTVKSESDKEFKKGNNGSQRMCVTEE